MAEKTTEEFHSSDWRIHWRITYPISLSCQAMSCKEAIDILITIALSRPDGCREVCVLFRLLHVILYGVWSLHPDTHEIDPLTEV